MRLEKNAHNPNNMRSQLYLFIAIKKSRSISDILGISLSLVCAIQCAIAPILLSIAPIIPKWAHFGHGWVWISFILFIAAWSIGRGFNKHKNKAVLYLAVIGVGFLLAGTFLDGKLSILMESVVFVTGGVLLTIAHWKNYKLEGACSS